MQASHVAHGEKHATAQRLNRRLTGSISLMEALILSLQVVDFRLSQPLQASRFNGLSEVVQAPNDLNDQDHFRFEPGQRASQAGLIACEVFFQMLDLSSNTGYLGAMAGQILFPRWKTIALFWLENSLLRENQQRQVLIRHTPLLVPYSSDASLLAGFNRFFHCSNLEETMVLASSTF